MGNSNTTQADIEKLIVSTVTDFSRAKYTLTVLVLNENVRSRSPLTTHAVKVIKAIVKSSKHSNIEKYRALHLLKETLKVNDRSYREQCNEIIMERLRQLALSSYGEKVLLGYNQKGDLRYSRKFHRLLLECFAEWHLCFGQTNRFFVSTIGTMKERKLYPTSRVYYLRFQVGKEKSLAHCATLLRQARLSFVELFAEGSRPSLRCLETDSKFFLYERQVERLRSLGKLTSAISGEPLKKEAIAAEFRFLDSIKPSYLALKQGPESASQFLETFRASYCQLFGREENFPDFEILFRKVEQNKVSCMMVGYLPTELNALVEDPLDAESVESADEKATQLSTAQIGSMTHLANGSDRLLFGSQQSIGDIHLAAHAQSSLQSIPPSVKQLPYVPATFANLGTHLSLPTEVELQWNPPSNTLPSPPVNTKPKLKTFQFLEQAEAAIARTASSNQLSSGLRKISDFKGLGQLMVQEAS